jgi:transcriptional regulator with XRE-family HTH domain
VELGAKLRAIRTSKGLSLQRVANLTELSKSFVSQVESGAANPSMASLKRIANGLGISLVDLFDSESNGEAAAPEIVPDSSGTQTNGATDVKVVRQNRRKTLAWPGSTAKTYLLTPDLRRQLEVTLNVYQPGDESGAEGMIHAGEEFGLILEGCLEVTVGGHIFRLEEGDTVTYPSHIPHRTRALGEGVTRTVWVITPPSF